MTQASGKSIVAATFGSLAAAVLALVLFVLPAEYGIDPTGLGERMGIKDMAGYQVSALSHSSVVLQRDRIEFPLAPFESIEYKYRLEAGQAMVYAWHSPGEVVYELHSEPDGGTDEDVVSFAIGRSEQDQGSYVAPFSGIHGWFWENRGSEEVTVTLSSAGFYTAATTFSANGEYVTRFGTQ